MDDIKYESLTTLQKQAADHILGTFGFIFKGSYLSGRGTGKTHLVNYIKQELDKWEGSIH